MLKIAALGVAALAGLYGAVVAGLFVLMGQSNVVAGKALNLVPGPLFAVLPLEAMWCEARKGRLELGQEAPDFDLPTRDGSSRVRLSSLRGGKPIVLMFASYTCPPFRRELPAVQKVRDDYKDRAEFYFVYISEAHARDVWPLPSNEKAQIAYATHASLLERQEVAATCSKGLKVDWPMLIDDMEDGTDRAYTAWPTRLYVVDPAGRIAYKSRPGPFGFEAAGLRAALETLLPNTATEPPPPATPSGRSSGL
jgi:type I thyroxine 5'-deiodinase